MSKKVKNIILFIFLAILWLGAICASIFGIIGLRSGKFDDLSSTILLVLGSILTPILSQLISIPIKVIHFYKVKGVKNDIEQMRNEIKQKHTREINDRHIF